MPRLCLNTLEELRALEGREVVASDWLEITQERVDRFAEATGDSQWIHVDQDRARRESPFGAPVAHGYLVLSLLAKFAMDSIEVAAVRMGVNYGLNRVRFTAPVKVGARIRARFTLSAFNPMPGGAQCTWLATVDIEGEERAACVAELISRLLT